MNVKFYPPENQEKFASKTLTLLLAAALPAAQEQLKSLIQEKETAAEKQSA